MKQASLVMEVNAKCAIPIAKNASEDRSLTVPNVLKGIFISRTLICATRSARMDIFRTPSMIISVQNV